jgi:protease-4
MGKTPTSFSAVTGGAVAVIRVDGVIAGSGSTFDGIVTPEYFYDLINRAEEDARVKAIVLRVDSPGGTVAASEEIARYVEQAKKPIVVSVGDVGASGAYMMASQADQIWAMPGSAVGSIGVISEIPNVEELLGKVGVDFQVITAGKYKDAGSPYRPLTTDERALIQGSVDEAYGQFIDIVAAGRKMPRSEVASLATGWTWSGSEAQKLGLVDKLGTNQDALDAAAKLGGIKGDYDVISYEDEFGNLFGSLLGITSRLGSLDALSGSRDGAVRRSLPR